VSRSKNKSPREFDIEIVDLSHDGRGVYAAAPIPAGSKIIEYTGERISWDGDHVAWYTLSGEPCPVK